MAENDEFVKPTKEGMWIPMPLAVALLECYFGAGPRYREARTPTPAPVVPLQSNQVQGPPELLDPTGPGTLQPTIPEPPRFVPRGFAARKLKQPGLPENGHGQ